MSTLAVDNNLILLKWISITVLHFLEFVKGFGDKKGKRGIKGVKKDDFLYWGAIAWIISSSVITFFAVAILAYLQLPFNLFYAVFPVLVSLTVLGTAYAIYIRFNAFPHGLTFVSVMIGSGLVAVHESFLIWIVISYYKLYHLSFLIPVNIIFLFLAGSSMIAGQLEKLYLIHQKVNGVKNGHSS